MKQSINIITSEELSQVAEELFDVLDKYPHLPNTSVLGLLELIKQSIINSAFDFEED